MEFCLYTGVLGPETNAAIYRFALGRRDQFQHSRIAPGRVDPRTRVSAVVYDDQLAEVAGILESAVKSRLDDVSVRLDIPAFEWGSFEIQLTSHTDGAFFRRHTDSASRATATRALTFVYYFHREPKPYTGGELVFFDADGRETVIEPKNDSMILFDPRTAHEVRPTACPTGRFEDGRFTLNGWVHRRAPKSPQHTFFDQKIFAPVDEWVRSLARNGGAGGGGYGVEPRGAGPATRARSLRRAFDRHAPSPRGSDPEHLRRLLILYGDLHRQHPRHDEVDVRPSLSGDEFFADYYTRNRPVLIRGAVNDSRAVGLWTPEYFAENYGSVPVQITADRHAVPDYEVRFRETIRTVPMGEFVRRMAVLGESNELYIVARNRFFESPQLRPLREDVRPPTDIIDDSDRSPGAAKLWFGPGGTVTPLHFDEHSILFTQIHGRKRFKLIPSFDYERMYVRDTYYSEVDAEHPDSERYPLFAGASVMDVIVEPGDALFLPAAWWHWARALSSSISVTFSSFALPQRNTGLIR